MDFRADQHQHPAVIDLLREHRQGFLTCPSFTGYDIDPNSTFMTLALVPAAD